MSSSSMFGRLALLALVITGPACAEQAASAPDGVTPAATKAKYLRLAAAYDMDARFYRAAGKPSTAFLARRYAALSEAYRLRALTGFEAGT